MRTPNASRDSSGIGRRRFLGVLAGGAAVACSTSGNETSMSPTTPLPETPSPADGGTVPTRRLGRTNVMVSMLGLGGAHLGAAASQEEAVRIVRTAIDNGITFMDNCWDYNGGRSEEWMGAALADGYRQRAFLMTKLDGRTAQAASDQLEQSLRRLQTDVIDLIQVHEVIHDTDPARVWGPGGTMEALFDARQKGSVRFIGFTGHKDPSIHLAMLQAGFDHGFTFDTVQMPINVMDAHYRSFEHMVLPVLQQHDIGILGMKSMGAGDVLTSGVVSAVECLRYALSRPTSVVITGCESLQVLDQAISLGKTFTPLTADETSAILTRTAPLAADGRYERFKTTTAYDGTTQHPGWLESAVI